MLLSSSSNKKQGNQPTPTWEINNEIRNPTAMSPPAAEAKIVASTAVCLYSLPKELLHSSLTSSSGVSKSQSLNQKPDPENKCRMGDAVVVRVVETKRRSSEVSPWDGLPGTLEQKSVEFSEKRKESLRARYLYGIIFLLANLVAWCARDYGQKLSPLLH
ncbi:hypothetical protein C3L33_17462, partial [Rhododendron williamsianum]